MSTSTPEFESDSDLDAAPLPTEAYELELGEVSTTSLAGQRVAFVGKLGGMNRKEARELVRRQGGTMLEKLDPSVDLVVIGADAIPLGEPEDLLDDWVLDAKAAGELSVITETRFWQDLGIVEPGFDVGQLYTPAMLAGLLELPISTIRRWHRRGLITPTRQFNKLSYFDFQEVASARRIARLIASGATPQAIENKLSRLAGLYPNLQRPLSQLSVIIEGRCLLLRQGAGLIEPGGQMRIDFDSTESELDDVSGSDEDSQHLISIESPVLNRDLDQLASPDEFIEVAISYEDEDDPQSAVDVYRMMSLTFGPTAESCFRMAELLYQLGDLAAARERYFIAVELDETFVEARASLGCILVELNQQELALSAFQGALEHHADYPDVHFHLARLLDDLDRDTEAEQHWMKFIELAPKSPWAEEARQRLAGEAE